MLQYPKTRKTIKVTFGETVIAAFNILVLLAIFTFDAITPADNVSVCFAYTIPIVLSILEGGRRYYVYLACAIVFSIVGAFIQPPNDEISVVFLVNRLIAIVTLCIMTLLVRYRLAVEAAFQQRLERQREQLERQNRFIAVLSHEVRTPLTVMDGQAYRLIKHGHAMRPEDVEKRAKKIRAAAARLDSIITAVLTLTSVGTDTVSPNVVPVDLKQMLTGIVQNITEESAAMIDLELDALPDSIAADPALLTQAFENIINNAMKYSPLGSPVSIDGFSHDDDVVVRVVNQGAGIAADDLQKIFIPYFRGSNSRGISGAGIGLYLVDRFVSAHGGETSVESQPGQGVTVTVRLPRAHSRDMDAVDA